MNGSVTFSHFGGGHETDSNLGQSTLPKILPRVLGGPLPGLGTGPNSQLTSHKPGQPLAWREARKPLPPALPGHEGWRGANPASAEFLALPPNYSSLSSDSACVSSESEWSCPPMRSKSIATWRGETGWMGRERRRERETKRERLSVTRTSRKTKRETRDQL